MMGWPLLVIRSSLKNTKEPTYWPPLPPHVEYFVPPAEICPKLNLNRFVARIMCGIICNSTNLCPLHLILWLFELLTDWFLKLNSSRRWTCLRIQFPQKQGFCLVKFPSFLCFMFVLKIKKIKILKSYLYLFFFSCFFLFFFFFL